MFWNLPIVSSHTSAKTPRRTVEMHNERDNQLNARRTNVFVGALQRRAADETYDLVRPSFVQLHSKPQFTEELPESKLTASIW